MKADTAPELLNALKYRITVKRILAQHLDMAEQAIAFVQVRRLQQLEINTGCVPSKSSAHVFICWCFSFAGGVATPRVAVRPRKVTSKKSKASTPVKARVLLGTYLCPAASAYIPDGTPSAVETTISLLLKHAAVSRDYVCRGYR